MKLLATILTALSAGLALAVDEVAGEALRDGLYGVARAHAEAGDDAESRLMVLESLAHEDKWQEIVDRFRLWGLKTPPDQRFACYLANAHHRLGQSAAAVNDLAAVPFDDPRLIGFANRIRAQIALEGGDSAEAFRLVGAARDVDSMMLAAEAKVASGDRAGAERIWREVVADTNAAERAFRVASVNLADAKPLRIALARAADPAERRFIGLRLAQALFADAGTFEEGAKLVRAIVKDAPDTEGATEAMIALARAHYDRARYDESAAAYAETMEIWPEAARLPAVHEGRGWALMGLGRPEEAYGAFVRAEETSTNDETRASAVLKQGDALSECGRGGEAMVRYRTVLGQYPDTAAARLLKGHVEVRELESQGREAFRNYRFADAQRIFDEVAEKDPERKPRMDYYGVLCRYGQGMDEEAEARAKELAKGCSNLLVRAESTLWLAKLAYNRGAWSEAGRLFSSYAEMRPTSPFAPEALVWAARAAFADNDFPNAVTIVTDLAGRYPDSPSRAIGLTVQGEALIEMARFDEAVLVLEQAALAETGDPSARIRAQVLRGDALFAMGADNPARYLVALEAYKQVRNGEATSPSMRIAVSFKIARTLEKLKRMEEAIDEYYSHVVQGYRKGREGGIRFDDEARAAFSRAAFRLADEYENRGNRFQAVRILELVVTSDVPAADEAEKRIERIERKGYVL